MTSVGCPGARVGGGARTAAAVRGCRCRSSRAVGREDARAVPDVERTAGRGGGSDRTGGRHGLAGGAVDLPGLWTPAGGRADSRGRRAGAHRPLEISRANAVARPCVPAARFPQFHSALLSRVIEHRNTIRRRAASAGAGSVGHNRRRTVRDCCRPGTEEDHEGVFSQSEYTLMKPSSCPDDRDHFK